MAINIQLRSPIKFGNLLPERSTDQALVNLFNEAFLSLSGVGYTSYNYDNQTYITKCYNENSDVYSVVSQISRKFAAVPGLIMDGDKEVPNPLRKPNYYQSESEYKELWETFMLLTGNAYQWILSPKDGANAGVPVARFLLPSHLMQIVLKKDADLNNMESPIDYYMLIIGKSYIEFRAEDVIHSKFPNPNYDLLGSHLYGRSPIAAALRDVETQNVTKQNNIKTMNSGGAYGFLHPLDGKTPWTPEQAKEAKERLKRMASSSEMLSKFEGVSAPIGFTKISIDTDKLQPFEFLKYSQKQICNALGWSDKLLNNDEGAKYDNLGAAWKMSISNRIAPDLRIYEEGLNEQFYSRWKRNRYSVKFDVSELPEMQADMTVMVEWLVKLLDRGVLNRDEVRMATKYSELKTPESQQYTVQSGTIPIEDIAINDEGVARSFNIEP